MAELGSTVFLNWVRGRLTGNGRAPAAGALPRLTAVVDVTVTPPTDPGPINATFDLYGPADVSGIAPAQILRTDPKPGEPEAEPNYLCIVEFDAPELPWVLSPEPEVAGHVQPWIALVVVKDEPGRIQQRSGASLPLLRCPGALLPRCEESWAWAHAQVVPHGGDPVDAILDDPGQGGRTLSRLICPTRLEEHTSYIACVVPTFLAGVLTQTGKEVGGDGLLPAWREAGDAVLPVYHSWRFRTGVAGDFEDVARLLHPVAADRIPGLGRSALAVAAGGIPGLASAPTVPALRTLLTTETETDLMASEQVDGEVQRSLAAIVDPAAVPADPPTVQPPAYGRWPAQRGELTEQTPGWFGDLNRSPAHRVVARLGADLIRTQQEELVAEARRQAGEYARARAARDRLRLSELASRRLVERRIAPLDPARVVAAARPAHVELEVDAAGSIADLIAGSTVDPALLGRAMARVSSVAARQMQVPQQALRREVVAGTFARTFTVTAVEAPVLTDQVDRLRAVYARADLLDVQLGNTTIAGIIDTIAVAATAQAELVERVAEMPISFVEPEVEPVGPVGPDDGGIDPGTVVIVDPGSVVIDPGTVVFDPGAVVLNPHIAHHIGGEIGAQIDEQIDPGIAGRIDAVLTRGSVGFDHIRIADAAMINAGVIDSGAVLGGVTDHLDVAALTTVLSDESLLAVTAMLGESAVTVASAIGGEVAAIDVNAFTVDATTVELTKRFRDTLAVDATVSPVNAGGALRASLGLEVTAPIRRDALSAEVQGAFDRAVTGVIDRSLIGTITFGAGDVATLDMASVAETCLAGIQPARTHATALSNVLASGTLRLDISPLVLRLGFVPQFTAPLAARLERSLNSWILAGAGGLPANAVTLVATNPAFIEAFTAGANHEMAAELLWRDVPSDPRGTVFPSFWAAKPLAPIHTWSGGLGANADGGESLVAVVIRSPLLRRYPNTLVYAAKQLDAVGGFTPDPATVRTVLYQGFIEPDATYSVIDLPASDARDPEQRWFILVSQPITDARFGLDEWSSEDPPAPPRDWNDVNWGHVGGGRLSPLGQITPPERPNGVAWARTPAEVAYALHQDPFRIVLPAAKFLPKAV